MFVVLSTLLYGKERSLAKNKFSIILSRIADGAVRGGKSSDIVNRFIAGNAADGVMVVVA